MADPTIFQPSNGALPPGTQLNGIYEIDAHLASGGMGDVYRGHELQTGEPVAIKVIRTDLADNEAALAMFRREASALNRLHHEAIVRYYVFSLDPVLRRHYLAMELVEGHSLGDVLRNGPLSPAQALVLLRRVASGLGAAHERGIIHRDISPDNIIVSQGDYARARIIDFGIARSTRVGDATVLGGGFAGKYNYVSPEQLGHFGGEVTGRSDIYSLGLVIAQALLGKPIDMGGSQLEIIDKRRKVPDLSGIAPEMRPLLERMLQPDPAARFATMQEAIDWQQAAPQAQGRKGAAPTPPRAEQARSDRAPAPKPAGGGGKGLVIGLAVLVLGGVGGFLAWLNAGSKPVVKAPEKEITLETADKRPPVQPPVPQEPNANGGTGPNTPTDTAQNRPIDCSQPALQKDAIIAWTEKCGKPPGTDVTTGPAVPATPVEPPAAPTVPTAPPVPTAPTAPPPSLEGPVRKYVRGYDIGECAALLPGPVGDKSADVDGYGVDDKPFHRFDKDFKDRFTWEASIGVRLIKPAQCAAMPFVARLVKDGSDQVALSTGVESLKSRDTLTGTVESRGGAPLLLLVDDDGDVHDITSQATGDAQKKTFRLRLEMKPGTTAAAPILLIAVTGADIPALKAASNVPGKRAFPKALEQLGKTTGASVAVKFVTLEP
ncbi:serine/threonine-protein kinase [uncultured Alsobacter sp.]|uniref:serine/threonine-protein kinase n=1 Tax=uncultured Alsobacter sp. TaxID=1748258 RepID=UPI0025E2AFB2|nr:serine/threonine-protein kinase [uncultured Alsobacter sp.]